MSKLTINEEKVRKILMKHPHGVKASTIIEEGKITKSPLYIALNRLEEKELAFRGGHNLWYPENPIQPQSGHSGLNWLERRAERKAQEKDRKLREAEADLAIAREMLFIPADKVTLEKRNEIILKWKKKYKLL